jgi:hypothetical protein
VKTVFPWELLANVHRGVILPEYGFIGYSLNDYTSGFELNILHQTSGKTIWEQLYRYPGWGLSFFYSTMGNAQVFGNQFSLYPYYRLHLIEKQKWSLFYQMGVGATWVTQKFHLTDNFTNLAIASNLNIHYHADFLFRYDLNARCSVNGGLSFNHISNANLSEPNVGLNAAGLTAGVIYGMGKPIERITNNALEEFKPVTRYSIILSGGMKHTRTFESYQYPALTVSFDINRRPFYKFAFSAGIDFFYDSSIEPQLIRKNQEFKSHYAYSSGVHLSQEFIYNRFSLLLHEGVYIGLKDRLNGYSLYNRAIVRWQFTNHFFTQVSMKSHLYILDFPELGLGYYW